MSSITLLSSVFLASSLLPLPSLQDGKAGQGGAPPPGSQPPKIVEVGKPSPSRDGGLALQRGERLVGTDLFDSTGARVGKVDDLVFDAKGNISHVVLQGDVGGQPRLIPIPWSTLTFPTTTRPGIEGPTDKLTGNFISTRIQSAPNFDSAQWPKDGQDSVFTEADAFFRSSTAGDGGIVPGVPANASAPRGALFRASRMRNVSVMDDSGKALGSLGQFVIDSNTGRITYATMNVTNQGGGSPRVIAVPWETFTAARQNDRDQLRLGLAMDRLQTAPEFQAGTQGWNQMSDPAWVSNVYTYYSARPYWTEGSSVKPMTPKPAMPPDKGKPSRP